MNIYSTNLFNELFTTILKDIENKIMEIKINIIKYTC